MASKLFVRCCLVSFLLGAVGLGKVSGDVDVKGSVLQCENKNDTLRCQTSSSGAGWIVIQQRFAGLVSFNRKWTEYREGFGEVGQDNEFWWGLERIHQLTKDGGYELLVEVKDLQGEMRYARYSEFVVEGEPAKYRLAKLAGYSGTAGDMNTIEKLYVALGQKFSTKDNDNDSYDTINCADIYFGGWWYNQCGRSLNSMWNNLVRWYAWKDENLTYTRMLIRARE